MSAVIKLVGLAGGVRTAYDGQYIVEYDPDRTGCDPDGRPMLAHVITTPDRTKAKRYADAGEAWADWSRVSRLWPRRPDGQPNRPLTAYTVEITDVS